MKSAKKALDKGIQQAMKGKNIKVMYAESEKKYSKTQYLEIYKAYDFLENLLVVRPYILRRYNLDTRLFELMLKLMGLKVFTQNDYNALPKQFTYARFNSFLESGYVNLVSDHWDSARRIYSLNTKGRNIVINFYKYLSGEKRIPMDARRNPMADKNEQIPFDKKKLALIKKLNELPIKDHMKKLYE